jgi:glycopeptide antibiotics resistance protein
VWYVLGAVLIVAVVVTSLIPELPDTDIKEGDKLAHLLAYGWLMFWFGMVAATSRARFGWAVALAALGVGLEYAQRMTGYRSFDVLDMVANTAGVGVGWLVAVTPAGKLLHWVDGRLTIGRTR